MLLQTMELQNIRSYADALFSFEPGVNIIVGPNASGKTNLLEAIHAAAQGTGFKSDDQHFMKRGSDWAKITALFDGHERFVKFRSATDKSFTVDGVDYKRLGSRQSLPIVVFEPSDMLLLGGEPERRRSYIDRILSQTKPHHKQLLANYKRALLQRNRLLKQENVTPAHVFAWDIRVSELAGEVVLARLELLKRLNEQMTNGYQSISGSDETIELSYESKIQTQENYASELLRKLKADFQLDTLRGYTGAGPHRDDIRITLNSNDVRQSASRGETRTVLLALKIIELQLLEEFCGSAPLLLLDDVFSELDGKRRRMLADHLKNYQTFITTTDADAIIKSYLDSYHVISM